MELIKAQTAIMMADIEKARIERMIKVLQGYNRGEKIEVRPLGNSKNWEITEEPTWDWSNYEYRIVLSPWEREYEDWAGTGIDEPTRKAFEAGWDAANRSLLENG